MQKAKRLLLLAARSPVKYLALYICMYIVNWVFVNFSFGYNLDDNITYVIYCAIIFFLTVSVAWAFFNYDKRSQKYFADRKKRGSFAEYCFVFISAELWIDFIFEIIFIFLAQQTVLKYVFNVICNVLGMNVYIAFAILAAVLFLINANVLYDVRKRWLKYSLENKNEIVLILQYVLYIIGIYSVGMHVFLAYLPGILTYVWLIRELFVPILAVIIISAVTFFFIGNYRSFSKRKKFIKKLYYVSKENNCKLEFFVNPYKSVFRKVNGKTFDIEVDGQKYSCKLVSGKGKSTSLIFTEAGEGNFKYSLKLGKKEIASFYSVFDYRFESEGKKIIIITAVPNQCYIQAPNGKMQEIDNGEKLMEYVVFGPDAFLGAMERNCIERFFSRSL